MGCDSPDSNFNNYVWLDGQWYCQSGWDDSWTGPLEALRDKFGAIAEPHFDWNGWRWSLARAGADWVATPLGRVADMDAADTLKARQDALAAMVTGADPLDYYAVPTGQGTI